METRHRLIQGDCLKEMQDWRYDRPDLIFTSPPYFNAREYSQWDTYEEYLVFLNKFITLSVEVIKSGRPIVINISCVIEPRAKRQDESTRRAIPFDLYALAKARGLELIDDIIWEKPDGASARAVKFSHHRRPVAYKAFQITEYLLVFRQKGMGLIDGIIRSHSNGVIGASLVLGDYERTNVWHLNPETDPHHPAPFPLALAERVVSYYSFCGDLVLDPFAGRGTVGMACKKLGRNSILIEQNEAYCSLIRENMSKADTLPKQSIWD